MPSVGITLVGGCVANGVEFDILVASCLQLGSEGKRLRPTVLLLMASSLSAAAAPPPELLAVDLRPPATHITEHRRRQQRVAEVMPRAWAFPAAWALLAAWALPAAWVLSAACAFTCGLGLA